MHKMLRKTVSLLVAMVLVFSFSISAFAATPESAVEATEEVDSAIVDELYDEIAEYEAESGISPATSDYTIIDKVGTTSNSSTSFSFDCLSSCFGTVSLVMCCKYTDGSTGTIKTTVAHYTFSSVKVDGTGRVIATGMYIPVGTYTFKMSGIDSKITYVIRMYCHVD